MRIGIDTRDLFIARTGARTYLEEIIGAFPRVSSRHQLINLQPRSYKKLGTGPLGKILEHLRYFYWKQVELPSLAKSTNCDLIFCTDYTAPLFPPCPVVPVFHDANFWINPENYNRFWRSLMNIFAVPAARKAVKVVTVSEFSRAEIAQTTGIPISKIAVIPNAPKGSTLTRLSESEVSSILARFGIDREIPFALHVGVMEKRKNLPRLIEAFFHFTSEIKNPYQLVLVGQPGPKQDLDDSSAVKSAIERFNLEEKVIITGHVLDQDLPAFYQGAIFFVFPTIREGFGIPVLEAFKNGLPVIASNSTSIPEIAGEAAILFNPSDISAMTKAMLQVSCDENLRAKLIHAGYERATLYSWEKTVQQLINLFEQIHSAAKI